MIIWGEKTAHKATHLAGILTQGNKHIYFTSIDKHPGRRTDQTINWKRVCDKRVETNFRER
jgi:hypothetical protein